MLLQGSSGELGVVSPSETVDIRYRISDINLLFINSYREM